MQACHAEYLTCYDSNHRSSRDQGEWNAGGAQVGQFLGIAARRGLGGGPS